MENLLINKEHKLDVSNFIRVGDLSYFEGPMLTLFEDLNTGNFYLFDWVDRDEKSNRWLIYNVSPEYLLQYLSGEITHTTLFENRVEKNVYYMDIDSQNDSFRDFEAFELSQISEKYLPNPDNFFDVENCLAFEEIKTVLTKSLFLAH